MASITVKIRTDRGPLGTHPKYGKLIPGATITIDDKDFGEALFERPSPDWRSPHEQADAARAADLKKKVGHQAPPAAKQKGKEVTDHA